MLSEKFIDRYQENIIWYNISWKNKSVEFIRKYKHKHDWTLEMFLNYNPEILDIVYEYVDWKMLTAAAWITLDSIAKYANYVDWIFISKYIPMTDKFIEVFNLKIHIAFLVMFQPQHWNIVRMKCINRINWNNVSRYFTDISFEFVQFFDKSIIWDQLSQNSGLTIEMMHRFNHKLNWKIISQRLQITDDIIEQFTGDLDWFEIYKRSDISLDFKIKYITRFRPPINIRISV